MNTIWSFSSKELISEYDDPVRSLEAHQRILSIVVTTYFRILLTHFLRQNRGVHKNFLR